MTDPHPGFPEHQPLSPIRGGRPRDVALPEALAPSPTDYDDAEIARGQSAAVLGALGRMQLKLDVLAREQSIVIGQIQTLLERLESRLAQTAASTLANRGDPSA